MKSDHNKKLEEELDALLSELTFFGSKCTKDCSGHRAGWQWERERNYGHRAGSHSNSFNNGTEIAAIQTSQGRRPIGPMIRGAGGRFVKFKPIKEEHISETLYMQQYIGAIRFHAIPLAIQLSLKQLKNLGIQTYGYDYFKEVEHKLSFYYQRGVRRAMMAHHPKVLDLKFVDSIGVGKARGRVDGFEMTLIEDLIKPNITFITNHILRELARIDKVTMRDYQVIVDFSSITDEMIKTAREAAQSERAKPYFKEFISVFIHEYTHILQHARHDTTAKKHEYRSYLSKKPSDFSLTTRRTNKEYYMKLYYASPQEIPAFASQYAFEIINAVSRNIDLYSNDNNPAQVKLAIKNLINILSDLSKYHNTYLLKRYKEYNTSDKKHQKVYNRFLKLVYLMTSDYIDELKSLLETGK